MGTDNVNLGGAISAALGFLLLLLLPFETILSSLELSQFQAAHLGDLLKNLIIIAAAVVLIYRFGYQHIAGLTTLKTKYSWLIIVPLYFLLAGPIQYRILDYQFGSFHLDDVAVLLLAMLSVGFSEELVFRGFILPHLIKGTNPNAPLLTPITIAALLFGVLHFLNLLSADAHVALVLAQVCYATMFGVAFGILLLRIGSIFPIGLLHGFINFSGNLHDLPGASEPANIDEFRIWEAILSLIIVVPFFWLAWSQLRKIRYQDLLGKYEE